jgi:hypothetical protein
LKTIAACKEIVGQAFSLRPICNRPAEGKRLASQQRAHFQLILIREALVWEVVMFPKVGVDSKEKWDQQAD